MASLTLTLVVDKEKNRVVFAEADKDFVDILLSFLTLPLGTVIRLLGKQSMVGCVDKLYQSVENMDAECLETMACKTMLLQPRSEAERVCEDLKITIDDLNPRRFYRCPDDCLTLYSSVSAAQCECGEEMDKLVHWSKRENTGNRDGIFVKGGNRFIISDDLNVTLPYSMGTTLSLLGKHGTRDTEVLEKKTVDITRDKILMLLKRLMLSTTPLTDVFLLNLDTMGCGNEGQECDQLTDIKEIKLEDDSIAKSTSSIRVNILYDKLNKKVVSAQAGEDLVDVLFSFLTFPLGCIVKLLEGYSSVVCLDNLYQSVALLDGSFGIKSEECKNLLLAPKLDTHFGCSNQLLRTEEKPSQQHQVRGVLSTQVNPKLPSSGTESGAGYARKSVRFMITDEMNVTSLSPASGIDAMKQSKAPIHSFVEKEVLLGEVEVANLLKACLNSRRPLTNLFCSASYQCLLQ